MPWSLSVLLLVAFSAVTEGDWNMKLKVNEMKSPSRRIKALLPKVVGTDRPPWTRCRHRVAFSAVTEGGWNSRCSRSLLSCERLHSSDITTGDWKSDVEYSRDVHCGCIKALLPKLPQVIGTLFVVGHFFEGVVFK